MRKSSNLSSKLRKSDPEIGEHVKALGVENEKLHRRIARLEVKNESLENRIKAYENELRKNRPVVHINTNLGAPKPAD